MELQLHSFSFLCFAKTGRDVICLYVAKLFGHSAGLELDYILGREKSAQ
jgi:hypothetical protein